MSLGRAYQISLPFLSTFLMGTGHLYALETSFWRTSRVWGPRIPSPGDPYTSSIVIGQLGLPALVLARTDRQTCLLRHYFQHQSPVHDAALQEWRLLHSAAFRWPI
jgi:hypothetical protein